MSTANNTPSILQSTVLGGTAAVFAVNFTHPIELVKSRVQVNNLGVIQTISDTFKNEGFAAFWKVRTSRFCCSLGMNGNGRFVAEKSKLPRNINCRCQRFGIFSLVRSFLFLFCSGTALGLLQRRKVRYIRE